MARFLVDSDYNSIIQVNDLTQITEGDSNNLLQAEEKAVAKVRTKLIQRYDMNLELSKTGNNRYSLLVEIIMDLALYNLHARLNPRNIPSLRIERNKEALDQLDKWASGTDNAELAEKDADNKAGYSIVYGSSFTKNNNQY